MQTELGPAITGAGGVFIVIVTFDDTPVHPLVSVTLTTNESARHTGIRLLLNPFDHVSSLYPAPASSHTVSPGHNDVFPPSTVITGVGGVPIVMSTGFYVPLHPPAFSTDTRYVPALFTVIVRDPSPPGDQVYFV